MLKAIIFDFDGIIADTEPAHLESSKKILKEIGIELSDEDYFNKYLAYDDKTLFKKILREYKKDYSSSFIGSLIEKKHVLVNQLFDNHVCLFPGIVKFLDIVYGKYIISIASGALLAEIEYILSKYDLSPYFQSITSADEIENCKPNPESFIKALEKINREREEKIFPSECLVFEDSIHGVAAAAAAQMKCVGITNSYNQESLINADLVVDNFNEINLKIIENLFAVN